MKTMSFVSSALALMVCTFTAARTAHADEAAKSDDATTRDAAGPPVAAEATPPAFVAAPPSADKPAGEVKKAPFHEKGRLGVLGALTNDMWKVGPIFEHEYFEAAVLGHAGFESGGTRDIHLIFKAAGRLPLGALNYLALGGEFGPHWGSTEGGIKTGGSYQVGPYVSFQRYFAGTPLMINLWVCPVSYEYFENNDGSNNLMKTTTTHLFRQGGFGLAYLF
jgi:hypothetical protein